MSTSDMGRDDKDSGDAIARDDDEMVSEYTERGAGGALGLGNRGDGAVDGIGDDGAADDGMATAMNGPNG